MTMAGKRRALWNSKDFLIPFLDGGKSTSHKFLLQFQLTRTQLFVMTMNSSTTNPYLPCNVERDNLDFDAIVRDIVAEQEAVKRHIGTSVTSSLSVSG